MIAFFIALIIVSTIIIIVVSVVWWAVSLSSDAVWLSFSSFRKFYDIAPEKYLLYWDGAAYSTELYHWQYINMKTPIDYARYWLWWRKKKRHKKTTDKVKRTQEYINCVRKDLERFTREIK